MSEERRLKRLVITPAILLSLIQRFSAETAPADLTAVERDPLSCMAASSEFAVVPDSAEPPEWSPVLDITATQVDDAIDEVKSALDYVIDSATIKGFDREELSRLLSDALDALTEHVKTGGEVK